MEYTKKRAVSIQAALPTTGCKQSSCTAHHGLQVIKLHCPPRAANNQAALSYCPMPLPTTCQHVGLQWSWQTNYIAQQYGGLHSLQHSTSNWPFGWQKRGSPVAKTQSLNRLPLITAHKQYGLSPRAPYSQVRPTRHHIHFLVYQPASPYDIAHHMSTWWVPMKLVDKMYRPTTCWAGSNEAGRQTVLSHNWWSRASQDHA